MGSAAAGGGDLAAGLAAGSAAHSRPTGPRSRTSSRRPRALAIWYTAPRARCYSSTTRVPCRRRAAGAVFAAAVAAMGRRVAGRGSTPGNRNIKSMVGASESSVQNALVVHWTPYPAVKQQISDLISPFPGVSAFGIRRRSLRPSRQAGFDVLAAQQISGS